MVSKSNQNHLKYCSVLGGEVKYLDLIYDQVTLRHPVYDLAALAAQDEVRAFNGSQNTWFCGAWMRHGFHEDGLASAVDVVERMQAARAAPLAAE